MLATRVDSILRCLRDFLIRSTKVELSWFRDQQAQKQDRPFFSTQIHTKKIAIPALGLATKGKGTSNHSKPSKSYRLQ